MPHLPGPGAGTRWPLQAECKTGNWQTVTEGQRNGAHMLSLSLKQTRWTVMASTTVCIREVPAVGSRAPASRRAQSPLTSTSTSPRGSRSTLLPIPWMMTCSCSCVRPQQTITPYCKAESQGADGVTGFSDEVPGGSVAPITNISDRSKAALVKAVSSYFFCSPTLVPQ